METANHGGVVLDGTGPEDAINPTVGRIDQRVALSHLLRSTAVPGRAYESHIDSYCTLVTTSADLLRARSAKRRGAASDQAGVHPRAIIR